MTGLSYRYVFVGGLHRSGTSLTCRMTKTLPGVGGIEGAPVPENEGVYLQGGLPHHARSGVPMHFATDPAQHMTEDHPLNTLSTRIRIESDWSPWFPPDVQWRVEKSPVNMVRMRLLQQLFPLSQFILVVRHPEAVATAVAKWTDAPAPDLMDHWIAAHARALDDLSYVHNWLIVRYEDLVADPAQTLNRIAAFLDIRSAIPAPSGDVFDGNARYGKNPQLTHIQSRHVADWGYGPGLKVTPLQHQAVSHSLGAIRNSVQSVGRESGRRISLS